MSRVVGGCLSWCVVFVLAWSVPLLADEDDEPQYRAGLVARLTGEDGSVVTRLDDDVLFVWHDDQIPSDALQADPRLPAGPFQAEWRGRLFSIAPGAYRLHVYVTGQVQVAIDGKTVIDNRYETASWASSLPTELSYGYHPLTVRYAASGNSARLGLYWSGPQFQLEPIPERHLFHDPQQSPTEFFERGKHLVRALRCAACHNTPEASGLLPAPALGHLRGNISDKWIEQWLSTTPAPSEQVPPEARATDLGATAGVARRMPHLGLKIDESRAIAAYLLAESDDSPPVPKYVAPKSASVKKGQLPPRVQPDPIAGATLFNSLGCVACHQVGTLGVVSLFGGSDLSQVGIKRSREFFGRWLDNPVAINAAHRMPVFALTPLEREDLTEYLVRLGGSVEHEGASRTVSSEQALVERGRQLVVEHRCSACHELPKSGAIKPSGDTPLRIRLTNQSRWDVGCLTSADAASHRPGYLLNASDQRAVREYLTTARKLEEPTKYVGQQVLAERNCLACHARGANAGIAGHFESLTKAAPELATALPLLTPPSLSGVGDKLHDQALHAAIETSRRPLRPWLSIRMPKFRLAADELAALVKMLVDHDRIPETPYRPSDQPIDEAQLLAARRLVTADGFGCTSCHKIGDSEPVKVAINAHGTDLTLLGERIRRPWYDRWVRNPARIVPRMEMPAIQQPVRGVLGDDVNVQLAALWSTLNTAGFNPPPPGPVRVVRRRGIEELREPAAVVTDLLETPGRAYTRPIVIGLPNRHNILYDVEAGRLANWWIGDVAVERTRGKGWYWQPGGDLLLPDELPPDADDTKVFRPSELTGRVDEREVFPNTAFGECRVACDGWEHVPGGVALDLRVVLSTSPSGKPLNYRMRQVFTAIPNGFRRSVTIKDFAGDEILELAPLEGPQFQARGHMKFASEAARRAIQGSAGREPERALSVQVVGQKPGDERAQIDAPQDARKPSSAVNLTRDQPTVALDYVARLPVDQFPLDTPTLPPATAVKLDVVPGYQAIQLPLPATEMPTGLAWRRDGTLVFSSLKGRVMLARDTNGDGWEDTLSDFGDDLPAPYGVAANDDSIDVICKYGLVRLYDDDGDGRAERSEIVADGWGYTTDYHDWAVGLPRHPQGGYIVALPCQQDDRSRAAAKYRGHVVRLVPREPAIDNPRRFTIESLAAGFRFPMGLAWNQEGELFCSDNQGNYTPYNEVNHVRAGRRYGFVNKLEVQPGVAPPFETPAVELPHPWTRSVNGLCFLTTPAAVRERLGRDLFGPFEGDLLGCEFTTQRLIRLTLDRVGDTYQGAAYPFSTTPTAELPTFEGPIVAAIAPNGQIYVGNLRDSGWAGGQNTGSIVVLTPTGEVPAGIRAMRATAKGFRIEFTCPIDATRAADMSSYGLQSYRRITTPAYGGNNVDERAERIARVEVAADRRQVNLEVDGLRVGYVYELHVGDLSLDGRGLFPAEAYYTLRTLPE